MRIHDREYSEDRVAFDIREFIVTPALTLENTGEIL